MPCGSPSACQDLQEYLTGRSDRSEYIQLAVLPPLEVGAHRVHGSGAARRPADAGQTLQACAARRSEHRMLWARFALWSLFARLAWCGLCACSSPALPPRLHQVGHPAKRARLEPDGEGGAAAAGYAAAGEEEAEEAAEMAALRKVRENELQVGARCCRQAQGGCAA